MKPLRLVAFVCSLIAPAVLLGQGTLTPPAGPPAPAMKTLQQVEPRIDLQNAPAAAVSTTSSTFHYVINQPGSYYLSANISATKPSAIHINTAGVTLDLNGFQIATASTAGGDGILIALAAHGATVRNGSIKGFGHGVRPASTLTQSPRGCAFRDLAVSSCTAIGIHAPKGATLDSCRVQDSTGSYGFFAEDGAVLINCTATNNNVVNGAIQTLAGASLTNCNALSNTASTGIRVGAGSSLLNCSVRGNTAAYGIYADSGSSLTNCSASGNTSAAAVSAGIGANSGVTISNCSAFNQISTAGTLTPLTGMGILMSGGGTIKNCSARSNVGDGIQVADRCLVVGNIATSNGAGGGTGAGIHVAGVDNRIEGNNVSVNDRGIDVDTFSNIIVKNTASGNSVNWDVASGNVILVVAAAIHEGTVVGNSGGTAQTATDPNANFTY